MMVAPRPVRRFTRRWLRRSLLCVRDLVDRRVGRLERLEQRLRMEAAAPGEPPAPAPATETRRRRRRGV